MADCNPDLVVLSGGAETTAVAVVEAAIGCGLRPLVVAFSPGTLFRRVGRSCDLRILGGDTRERLVDELVVTLAGLAGQDALPVLPTEDDGLSLLHEAGDRLPARVRFSRARALSLGGLDKAELFAALAAAGLTDLIAPTMHLSGPEAFAVASAMLGRDCIVKPSFKPWRAALGPDGLKVISRSKEGESDAQVIKRLADVWAMAPSWIAQARLSSFGGDERSAVIVRFEDAVLGVEVRERFKHPAMGGTAVWVESVTSTELLPAAARIAQAIDLIGICELSFLRDGTGRPRLLELNARPWLQIQLVERSGFPIVSQGVRALSGDRPSLDSASIVPHHWLQPERWLLAALRGDRAGAWKALRFFLRLPRSRRIWSIWSSRLPGTQRLWAIRMARRAISFGDR